MIILLSILAALIILIYPADAHAYAAIGVIAGYIASFFTASGIAGAAAVAAYAVGVVIGTVVVGAVLVGASMALQALTGGKQDPRLQDYSASAFSKGLLLNKTGATEPIPVIYGSRRVGGIRGYMEAAGSNNENLHLILVLAEGPISAINTVYLNEIASTDAKYSGYVTVYKHLGAADQVADAALVSACAGWTSDHKLSGVAYLHVVLKYDQSVFTQGLPIITCDIDGRTVFDPRDDSTAFSRNPALCIRDYLTNTLYGRGIPEALIDDDSFSTAANYCDEDVTVGGVTQDRYTCDGGINVDESALVNVDRLLTSCRGMLVFSGGLYKLIIDKPETASEFEFNEDNITGEWTISLGNKKNMFNRIRARFFNPERSWQEDVAIVDSTVLRALDNGLVLEKQIELPFTCDINTARQITTINLNQSRQQIACTFTAFISGMRCEVGDVVPITHSTPAWSGKEFRVVGISLKNNDEVRVTAIEYDETVYDFGNISAVDATPNTNLSGPNDPVPNVASAHHDEEVYNYRGRSFTRWRIFFDPPSAALYPFWDHADIYVKIGAAGEWKYLGTSRGDYQIDPVEEGVTYYCRIVSVSIWGSKEVFTDAITVSKNIVGQVATPTDITDLSAVVVGNTVKLSATPISDPDIMYYEIRQGATWAGGTLVARPLASVSFIPGVRPGTYTFWMAPRNNAGNYGATPASVSCTVYQSITETLENDWAWDYSTGDHDNTEQDTYSGDNVLKCSHTDDELVGVWTSAIYDLSEIKTARIDGDFVAAFVAGTPTWGNTLGSKTWAAWGAETKSWTQLFTVDGSGAISAELYYGETSPPESHSEISALISPTVTARYVRVIVTITDPSLDSNAYLKTLNMKAYTS